MINVLDDKRSDAVRKKKKCIIKVKIASLFVGLIIVLGIAVQLLQLLNDEENNGGELLSYLCPHKIEMMFPDIYYIEVAVSGIICTIVMTKEATRVVTAFDFFIDAEGNSVSPAQEAGILVGDEILKVDGFDVTVSNVWSIAQRGSEIALTVSREGYIMEFVLKPAYSLEAGHYRIGLYVDEVHVLLTSEVIKGNGTISFFDPANGVFAALGHGVLMEQHRNRGYILGPRDVLGIYNNRFLFSGTYHNHNSIGHILHNGNYGVYGILHNFSWSDIYIGRYTIARPGEVQNGYARMLTTVNGTTPEWIDVRIAGIELNECDWITVFMVEDNESTIAPGMSGSVVIQNGKIIGIVSRGSMALGFLIAYPPERMFAEFLIFQEKWAEVLKD